MKTVTIQYEIDDEKAEGIFHELVEECAEGLISADKETLTLRVREI